MLSWKNMLFLSQHRSYRQIKSLYQFDASIEDEENKKQHFEIAIQNFVFALFHLYSIRVKRGIF